ncbi:uncharacterized protein LOC143286311 [Babylonia areolata]|uniref:uncharacterized protein LOC143286311 n=1 Tax=Babylonia areolata TaxID=304850 RepID=UPI003FD1ADE8
MLDDLGAPLKGSSRVRYTCMSVSRRYIAFGCNTGGVYVFGRDSQKHLQSIYGDVDACPVSVVALSPNELSVGFAVSSGQVVVMEMNIERRSKPERLRQTLDHLGTMVTAMVWDSASSSLFVGDCTGKVTHINVPTSKAKTIFSQPSQTIVRVDSGVSQLDWWGNKLLASSLTATYLLNTAKQQFSQIGKKPREGEFGACFYLEPSSKYPVIYCARPGSRMWEVDFEGNVLNTHQFKQLLATQPLPIISPGVDLTEALKIPVPGPQSVNFLQMHSIGEFILTWSSRSLFVFDPINVKVVLWTDALKGIKDVCIVKNEVYVFLDSQKVRRLVFLPILHLCAALVTRQRCLIAADLLLFLEHFCVKPRVLKHVKKELLPQLLALLREGGHGHVGDKVQAMLEDVSESSMESVIFQEEGLGDGALSPLYTTHSSGIVVVNDGILTFGDPDRRRSPNRFGGVLVNQPHSKSNRTSPLSILEENTEHLADRPENSAMKPDWRAEAAGNPPPSASESAAADGSVPEVMCEAKEYTELPVMDIVEAERGHSPSVDSVSDPAGRSEETGSPVPSVSEQTSEELHSWMEHVSTRSSVDENFTEHRDSLINMDTVSDSPRITGPDSVCGTEGHDEGTRTSEDTAGGETDDNQNITDKVEGAADDAESSASDQDAVDDAESRASNQGADIDAESRAGDQVPRVQGAVSGEVAGDCQRSVESVGSEAGVGRKDLFPTVPVCVRRAGPDNPSENIAKTMKKKKRRRVNGADIPLTSISSSETAQPTGSLKTDTDPDIISIATMDSIEEENGTMDDTTPATLEENSSGLKKTSSPTNVISMDEATESTDLREDTERIAAPAHGTDFSDSESVPPHLSSGRVNGHDQSPRNGDMNNVFDNDAEHADAGNDKDIDDATVLEEKALFGSRPGTPSEQLAFRVAEAESEVIPPLIERLSALGVAPASLKGEEGGGNVHDLSSVKSMITEASKLRIASVKERVTKFSTTTKSLIRRVKEKNLLASRSPLSGSPPFGTGSFSSSLPSKDDSDITHVLFTNDDALTSANPEVSASCPISLEPFLTQTEITHSQLRDRVTLLNQATLKAVLNTWATELNRTLEAYHRELHRQQTERQKEQQKGKAGNADLKHCESPSRQEQNSLRISMSENERISVNGELGQSRGVDSCVGSDADGRFTDPNCPEAGKRSGLVSSQEKGDGAVHAVNPVEQVQDREVTVLQRDDAERSANHDVHRDGSPTNVHDCATVKDGLTAECEETSTRQSHFDQSDSKFPNNDGCGDDASEHKVSVEVSGENDVQSALKSTPDEALSDSEVESPTDWSQVCHITDPFKLSPQRHTEVSTLVSYCLECGCFGNAASFFGLHTSETQTVIDREHISESVPSSLKSFVDTLPNLPSLDPKPLHHVSQESNTVLSYPSSAKNSSDLVVPSDPLQCSAASSAEQKLGTKSTSQNFGEHFSAPGVQNSGLREDGKLTKQCHDSENLRHVSSDNGGVRVTDDEERALFVRLYFHFVPLWRLRKLLMKADNSKVHATWRALISCCQALGHGDTVWEKVQNRDVTGALDFLRSWILPNKQAFLGHVASLFELNAPKVTDFLSEVPRQVKLADILHLCHLHAKPLQPIVSRYLVQRLGATPFISRMEMLREMCASSQARLAVLGCLLHLRSSFLLPSSSSSSSSPPSLIPSDARLKVSSDPSRFPPDLVNETLEGFLSHVKDEECCEALEVCWQHSTDLPLPPDPPPPTPATSLPSSSAPMEVCLFPSSPESTAVVGRDADLTDVQNTDASSSPECSRSDGEAGEQSPLESAGAKNTLTEGDTDDHNTLSWLSLGLLAAHHIGAAKAVYLLQECAVEERRGEETAGGAEGGAVLSADFFKACLALSATTNQQKLVIHNMLEKVDSYLWAKKPVHLTPQVHYAATQEKLAVGNSNTDDHNYHNLVVCTTVKRPSGRQTAGRRPRLPLGGPGQHLQGVRSMWHRAERDSVALGARTVHFQVWPCVPQVLRPRETVPLVLMFHKTQTADTGFESVDVHSFDLEYSK